MLGFARLFVVLVGAMLIALGAWIAVYGNEGELGLILLGIVTVVVGVACIAAITVERIRYRSAAAEVPQSVGPPAGEAPETPLEPRFRPTSEVFVDPTSGKPMRVFADPETGERRYRIEA
jgi:hypothetical protein